MIGISMCSILNAKFAAVRTERGEESAKGVLKAVPDEFVYHKQR